MTLSINDGRQWSEDALTAEELANIRRTADRMLRTLASLNRARRGQSQD